MAKYSAHELVLDVVCHRPPNQDERDAGINTPVFCNRNPFFFPVNGSLAGEVRTEGCVGSRHEMNAIGGVIPGYRLIIDTKNSQVRIEDRLLYAEHKPIRVAMKRALNTERHNYERLDPDKMRRNFSQENVVPTGKFTITNEPPANLATWLWWTRCAVNQHKLTIISGENLLPSPDDILALGRVQLSDDSGLSPKEGKQPFNFIEQRKPATAGKA